MKCGKIRLHSFYGIRTVCFRRIDDVRKIQYYCQWATRSPLGYGLCRHLLALAHRIYYYISWYLYASYQISSVAIPLKKQQIFFAFLSNPLYGFSDTLLCYAARAVPFTNGISRDFWSQYLLIKLYPSDS